MKKILAMSLLSLLIHAQAADLNLGCVTETPTTTFVAETRNGVVQFDLYHHNGVKFMPIHSGVITPNDLGTLSDRASLLADLGDHLSFTMPAESCQVEGSLFHCFGSQPSQEIGGHKVNIWAAYSVTSEEKSMGAGQWNYVTTNLAIEVDGQTLFLPMKYFENECFAQFGKIQSLKRKLLR